MNAEQTLSPEEPATLEITLPTALELCRLGLATMIDIRQSFEIEMKGAIRQYLSFHAARCAAVHKGTRVID